MSKSLNRMERHALYALKRQYGDRIQLYKLLDATTNVETGEKEINKDVFDLRRAIVLPTKISRETIQSISTISANKKFVRGGAWDGANKSFIIEKRDVPTVNELTMDDWIIYQNRRFQITDAWEYEFNSGWIVNTRAILGATPEKVINLRAEDNFVITQEGYHE